MKWCKGKRSPNPVGRPKGSVNRATRLKRRYGERLLRKLARMTFRSRPDPVAIKLLCDITIAKQRSVAACISLPNASPKDVAQFGRVVLRQLARGKLSPDIAKDVLGALAAQAQLIEHVEIVGRLEELERRYQRSQTLLDSPVSVGGRTYVQ